MAEKKGFRKFSNDLHLWLGIGSGLILFIVCLSGTVYTFRTEIEKMAAPAKYYAGWDHRSSAIPTDSIKSMLEKRYRGTLVSLVIPADPDMNYQALVRKVQKGKTNSRTPETHGAPRTGSAPSRRDGQHDGAKGATAEARPKTIFVNPYTGKVAPEEGKALSEFFATVMKIHRWLLLETSTGRIIVGSATIIFVFLIITGLVIWMPKRMKHWRQGLTIKFQANWKRINHDLHNALGFYAFIFLLVMALTGLCWSFEWYKDGLSSLLGAKVFKGRNEKPAESQPVAGASAIGVDEIIARTNTLFPYRGDLRINLPEEKNAAIAVSKTKTGFFAFSGADKVQFDRFTGHPLKLERFAEKRTGQKIADLIKPLHTGEIYGLFSKILYFIACLIGTSLPVTGTIIWINKLRKKKRRKEALGATHRLNSRPERSYEAEIGIS